MLAAAMVAILLPGVAAAESQRPVKVALGVGSHSSILGPPPWGLAASLLVLPGGALDRYGLRAAGRSDGDDLGELALTAGPIFEAGAARRRLTLLLFAEAGVHTRGNRPIAGGGMAVHAWVIGPLALTLESGMQLIVDGTDTELILGGALLIGVGNLHTPWRPEHLGGD